MDFLYEITLRSGDRVILHIEVESKDNKNMVFRLVEYNGLTYQRYKLPILHVVIYLGEKPSKMVTEVKYKNFYFAFRKIELRQLDTSQFLNSQIPEEVLLAILSNYPKQNTESILRLIKQKLVNLCHNETELTKYFNQLFVLSKLRKIDALTNKILKDMPVAIDLRKTILYKQGVVEGIEKGIEKGEAKKEIEKNSLFVKRLIEETNFSDEKIADLAMVDISFVIKIRAELRPNK